MGIKKSVVLSDENQIIVEKQYQGKWSFAVNQQFDIANEYAGVIRRLAVQLLPELSMEEWQYVLNAFSGCIHDERFRTAPRIASAVMDDYGVEILDDCTPEFQAIIRRLAALSESQQFAVREFAAWYWSDEAVHGESLIDSVINFKSSATSKNATAAKPR